jgi:putative Holliday junction resolvase
LLAERDVDVFVVGLPLNMDGSEGERAAAARELGRRLEGRFPGTRVAFQDERLSTKAAEDLLRETGLRRWQDRRGMRDAMSAVVILRDWIEAGEPMT